MNGGPDPLVDAKVFGAAIFHPDVFCFQTCLLPQYLCPPPMYGPVSDALRREEKSQKNDKLWWPGRELNPPTPAFSGLYSLSLSPFQSTT
jgi:hypothetical protein